jgi:peptide-methionine (S)-S-oxide reductase
MVGSPNSFLNPFHTFSKGVTKWRHRPSARFWRAAAFGAFRICSAVIPESSRHASAINHGAHAEAVEIIFDPEIISYRKILEFFFQIHDPTTLNRQGNDRGASYRSAIFYTSNEQKRVAEDTIADVEASGLWPGKVVTEIAPAGDFWQAEPEHQDYLQHYPDGYTCHFVRPNWKLPVRAEAHQV